MMSFIKNPNMPQSRVSLAVSGKIPDEYLKLLSDKNIEIIFCEDNFHIDYAVRNHADMCVVHLGENIVAVDKAQSELVESLKIRGYEVIRTKEEIKGEYPKDVKLNIALFGEYSVGAFKYTDEYLLNHIDKFKKINIKQGYAKCSMLPITETALITDDASVYNSLKNDFDVLLISKGDISLDGHEYGFIGGASAKISDSEVFFFGNIESHRDFNEICNFLKKYNCTMVYDKALPLTDFGGLATLLEYNN